MAQRAPGEIIVGKHAAFVTGTTAIAVANDAGGRPVEVTERSVPGRLQVPARSLAEETVYFVAEGIFEFMVGGPSTLVAAGSFVRVPAGVPHAFRNTQDRTGRLYSRSVAAAEPAPLLVGVSAA